MGGEYLPALPGLRALGAELRRPGHERRPAAAPPRSGQASPRTDRAVSGWRQLSRPRRALETKPPRTDAPPRLPRRRRPRRRRRSLARRRPPVLAHRGHARLPGGRARGRLGRLRGAPAARRPRPVRSSTPRRPTPGAWRATRAASSTSAPATTAASSASRAATGSVLLRRRGARGARARGRAGRARLRRDLAGRRRLRDRRRRQVDRASSTPPRSTSGRSRSTTRAALYVATGGEGRVYRVQQDGSADDRCSPRPRRTSSRSPWTRDGRVYAGSAPEGLVYRLVRRGPAVRARSTPPIREIKALDGRRRRVASTPPPSTAARPSRRRGRPPRRAQPAPAARSSAEVTVSESFALAPAAGRGSGAAAGRGAAARGAAERRPPAHPRRRATSTRSGARPTTCPTPRLRPRAGVLVGTGDKGKVYRVGDDRPLGARRDAAGRAGHGHRRRPGGGAALVTVEPGPRLRPRRHAAAAAARFVSKVKDADTARELGPARLGGHGSRRAPGARRDPRRQHGDPRRAPGPTGRLPRAGRRAADRARRPASCRCGVRSLGGGRAPRPTVEAVTRPTCSATCRPTSARSRCTRRARSSRSRSARAASPRSSGLDADPLSERAAAARPPAGTPPADQLQPQAHQRGLRTFSWQAEDPNGDALLFDVHYRALGDERWRPLRRGPRRARASRGTPRRCRAAATCCGSSPPMRPGNPPRARAHGLEGDGLVRGRQRAARDRGARSTRPPRPRSASRCRTTPAPCAGSSSRWTPAAGRRSTPRTASPTRRGELRDRAPARPRARRRARRAAGERPARQRRHRARRRCPSEATARRDDGPAGLAPAPSATCCCCAARSPRCAPPGTACACWRPSARAAALVGGPGEVERVLPWDGPEVAAAARGRVGRRPDRARARARPTRSWPSRAARRSSSAWREPARRLIVHDPDAARERRHAALWLARRGPCSSSAPARAAPTPPVARVHRRRAARRRGTRRAACRHASWRSTRAADRPRRTGRSRPLRRAGAPARGRAAWLLVVGPAEAELAATERRRPGPRVAAARRSAPCSRGPASSSATTPASPISPRPRARRRSRSSAPPIPTSGRPWARGVRTLRAPGGSLDRTRPSRRC